MTSMRAAKTVDEGSMRARVSADAAADPAFVTGVGCFNEDGEREAAMTPRTATGREMRKFGVKNEIAMG